MIKVVCDRCEKQFEMEFKTIRIWAGVTCLYFTCPYCSTDYAAYFSDGDLGKDETIGGEQ